MPAKTPISIDIRLSDQCLRCPAEEDLGALVPTVRTAKTLIRLRECPGYSESSLGACAILIVLVCFGVSVVILDSLARALSIRTHRELKGTADK